MGGGPCSWPPMGTALLGELLTRTNPMRCLFEIHDP
jgi:hypothetical protein